MTPKPWLAPTAEGPIEADITIPGSKSLTNRELLLCAIASKRSTVAGALNARDTSLMVEALRALGARIDTGADNWQITPMPRVLGSTPVTIDCGLAGTVMRFIPALAAQYARPVRFIADEQANSRPMAGLLKALRAMGAKVTYESDQTFPFTVQGPANVTSPIKLDSSQSSQFLSALLIVAPILKSDKPVVEIELVGKLPSKPHVEMTLEALRARGIDARWTGERTLQVHRGEVSGRDSIIEPDLSNAGPFLAAAAITSGHVRILHWPLQTTQAGNEWIRILEQMGARVNIVPQGAKLGTLSLRAGKLRGFNGDMSQFGELVPTLAAISAFADSPSKITGIGHLRGHETDRLSAIANELGKLGVQVEEGADYLTITPCTNRDETYRSPVMLRSYADHRMATFGAIIGLKIPGVSVDDMETVSKTMPTFTDLWHAMLEPHA